MLVAAQAVPTHKAHRSLQQERTQRRRRPAHRPQQTHRNRRTGVRRAKTRRRRTGTRRIRRAGCAATRVGRGFTGGALARAIWRLLGSGALGLCGYVCRVIVYILGLCRFCHPCRNADPKRVVTLKPPPRKSARKHTQRDYAGLQNTGVEQDPNRYAGREVVNILVKLS